MIHRHRHTGIHALRLSAHHTHTRITPICTSYTYTKRIHPNFLYLHVPLHLPAPLCIHPTHMPKLSIPVRLSYYIPTCPCTHVRMPKLSIPVRLFYYIPVCLFYYIHRLAYHYNTCASCRLCVSRAYYLYLRERHLRTLM